jgi:hypothetical protein
MIEGMYKSSSTSYEFRKFMHEENFIICNAYLSYITKQSNILNKSAQVIIHNAFHD